VAEEAAVRVEELSGDDAAGSRALHSERKILHELPDTSTTDLGPDYELAPRT
jgi:hypothetical protein